MTEASERVIRVGRVRGRFGRERVVGCCCLFRRHDADLDASLHEVDARLNRKFRVTLDGEHAVAKREDLMHAVRRRAQQLGTRRECGNCVLVQLADAKVGYGDVCAVRHAMNALEVELNRARAGLPSDGCWFYQTSKGVRQQLRPKADAEDALLPRVGAANEPLHFHNPLRGVIHCVARAAQYNSIEGGELCFGWYLKPVFCIEGAPRLVIAGEQTRKLFVVSSDFLYDEGRRRAAHQHAKLSHLV